jgi:hypothetical protein
MVQNFGADIARHPNALGSNAVVAAYRVRARAACSTTLTLVENITNVFYKRVSRTSK